MKKGTIPPPPAQPINYDEEIRKLKKEKQEQSNHDINLLKQLKESTESLKLADLGKTEIFLKESRNKISLGGKYDGYVLYRQNNRRWRFIKVKNFSDVFKMVNKHYAFIVDNVVGYFEDGKPFFIIDEKIPITLNTSARSSIVDEDNEPIFDGKDLCYDSKAFYIYLDVVTLKNLTPKEQSSSFDFGTFIAQWWWVGLIFLALMLFLFLTPMGKDIINQMVNMMPKNASLRV